MAIPRVVDVLKSFASGTITDTQAIQALKTIPVPATGLDLIHGIFAGSALCLHQQAAQIFGYVPSNSISAVASIKLSF